MRLERTNSSSQSATSPVIGSINNGVASNGAALKLATPELQSNGTAAARNGTTIKLEGVLSSSARAEKAARGDYLGHDRAEVTRILIQALLDLGYTKAAGTLETESDYTLESSYVANFRQAVLKGEWRQAENLLCNMEINQGVDCNEMLFYLREQKFLELLESRDVSRALRVLRMELTPLNHDIDKLHFLSSLMMCLSSEDVKLKAGWDGALGESRHHLLSQLSKFISPSIMLPEHRLATLLQQVKDHQVEKCTWHNAMHPPSLYTDHHCDRNQFPDHTLELLRDHSDEVYAVQFSNDGRRLASASKDKSIIIWDAETWEPIHTLLDHQHQVTNIQWSPDDTRIVSCSRDKTARIWDTHAGRCLATATGFTEPVSWASWAPDGQSFVTSSMEPYIIQWSLDGEQLQKIPSARTYAIAITPDSTKMVSASENKIHIYDFHNWRNMHEFDVHDSHLTSLQITKDSRFALVNTGLASEQMAVMVDLETGQVVTTYEGPEQKQWQIRGCFGGIDEHFVVSGSEDHNIYIWNRRTGDLVERLSGHSAAINCVAWNPVPGPPMFASAGDDAIIRIWTRQPPRTIDKGKMRGHASSNGYHPR